MKRKALALTLILVFLMASLIMATNSISATTPIENSWTSKAPMPDEISIVQTATLSGKIYVMGYSFNYEYDPTNDTWTSKTPMPTPRHSTSFAIAACQNKMYVIGGENGENGYQNYLSTNEVYDPLTDTWETKEPMPTSREGMDANVVDGKIYVTGGRTDNFRSINTPVNEVYDPTTDSWTIKASVPFAVGRPEVVVVDDEIFVIGSSRLQIYDPETDEWSQGEHPPVGGGYGAGVTSGVLAPRRIYVIPNAVYDLETESWMSASGLPSRRYGYGVGIVNDLFYAVGGHTYDSPWSGDFAAINVNEQYTPFGYSSPDLSPPPEPPPTSSPYTPLELTQGAMLGLAITVAVIFAGLGLLVYLIKRK